MATIPPFPFKAQPPRIDGSSSALDQAIFDKIVISWFDQVKDEINSLSSSGGSADITEAKLRSFVGL